MSWRRYLRRDSSVRDRSDELTSYLEIETDQNLERGMEPRQARRAAQKKLGNRTRILEEIYWMNTLTFFDSVARDLRHAVRGLIRNPGFASVAVLTLGLGIGANTAVFSIVNRVLIQPLPYPDSDRLVALTLAAPGAAGLTNVSGNLMLSGSMYFTFAEENRTFEELGIYSFGQVAVTGFDQPEQVLMLGVSDGTLQALDIAPVLGRWLEAEDQVFGGPQRAMLGYGYWQQRFGGDPSVIGKEIIVDSRPREIVGVMPREFSIKDERPDLFLPFAFNRSELLLPGFGFDGVGRLKPGVTLEEANTDIERLISVWNYSWPAFEGVDPSVYEDWEITARLRPLKDSVIGNAGTTLWIVMASLGIVMLIVCANVANLLLVRTEARRWELSTRAALGANRSQILRGLILESLVLGAFGGILGIGVAYASLEALVRLGPQSLPRLGEIRLDGWSLAFAAGTSLASGLLLGLIPALQYGKKLPGGADAGGRGMTESRERSRVRQGLVVAQVALALVLLVCSGLMVRTSWALLNVEPGFTDVATLQTLQITIPQTLVPEQERVARTLNAIQDELAMIPGVDSVGLISGLPLSAVGNWDVLLPEGQTLREGETPAIRMYRNVSPGYFATAGTRLVTGRDFTWADMYQQRPFVMLSENLAREFWGDARAAVGKRVQVLPFTPRMEVIGVVQDVRSSGIDQAPPPTAYWPAYGASPYTAGEQFGTRRATFVIRSDRAGTLGFLDQVRDAVWAVNSQLPLASVETMQTIYDRSMARTSFAMVILGLAGAMALLLGVIGIYGVISYTVSQRRREVGIRLALGAQPGALRRRFVRQALTLVGIGVVVGLAAAYGLTELMAAMLFEVSPTDPLTYAVVASVLIVAAMLASYLPARRAARVDPARVLHAE